MRQPAAGLRKQFGHVVEACGIVLRLVDQRQQLFQIVAEKVRFQEGLACAGVVQVAAQRVDFAVVGQIAERMGQPPRRERVRAVALMDERQRRREHFVRKILVEGFDLRRQHQAFVDDRLRAEAWEIHVQKFALQTAADDEDLPLQRVAGQAVFRHDVNLADGGAALAGLFAELRGVRRDVAPCENPAAFLFDDGLQRGLFADAVEHHADGVLSGGRQDAAQLPLEEIMRNHAE